jgi:hypothetical protein
MAMAKATIINTDLLVLVIDTKTGRVSVNGGPYREANLIARKLPKDEGPGGGGASGSGSGTGGSGGGTGESGGGSGSGPIPIDEIICAKRPGESDGLCRKFYRSSAGGELYETGMRCSGPCGEIG